MNSREYIMQRIGVSWSTGREGDFPYFDQFLVKNLEKLSQEDLHLLYQHDLAKKVSRFLGRLNSGSTEAEACAFVWGPGCGFGGVRL